MFIEQSGRILCTAKNHIIGGWDIDVGRRYIRPTDARMMGNETNESRRGEIGF